MLAPIVGFAYGVSAEFGRQFPVGLAPSQDVDAQALGQRHLCGEVGTATEAINT